jgi:hypothetical protein
MVSKDNVIVVTVFTVIGGLLVSVFSPVFSPLSEFVKDRLSGEPNTNVVSAMTFDNNNKSVTKEIENHETISSNSISLEFNASQESPFPIKFPYPYSFQCSLDGAPFEDCVSPKSYGNLATEAGHTFQVRAIGILGNVDKSPHKFYFTTITSASIESVIIKGNDSKESDVNIKLDYKSIPRTTITDEMGRFEFEGVGQGSHEFIVNSSLGPRKDKFFVPAGEVMMKREFDILEMSAHSDGSPDLLTNQNLSNLAVKLSNDTKLQDYTINLAQESKPNPGGPNPFTTTISLDATEDILSKIQNVTYYLHPTFNPSNINATTKENKFGITFTNWGKFDLSARVYFKEEGTSQDLILPADKWR